MTTSAKKTYKIAAIPGDGIGIEITAASIKALEALASNAKTFRLEFTHFDWSSKTYKERGYYIPAGGLDQLKEYDAIFFGAVGWPDVPDHVSLWGLMLPLRNSLCQYVNVRPTRILPGTKSPLSSCSRDDLDWVIIRENSEGEYAGHGGATHTHYGNAVATDTSIYTQTGIERVMHFAFQTARSRPKRKLTMVTKSNALRHGLVLWDRVFHEVREQYQDVDADTMLVDAMTARMVLHPSTLDTVVATNLHGDILSDLAAALSGSIGTAPSSNLDPTRKNPSMFEPIHGSAPDIAGKGVANPIGAFWSAAEMIAWVGENEASAKLMEGLANITSRGVKTRDLGGASTTEEVTKALCTEISNLYNS